MEKQDNLTPEEEQILFESKRNRGGCLSALLIVVIILNILGVFAIFAPTDSFTATNQPAFFKYLFPILSLINAGFGIAAWNWKKIGVYGFVASGLVAFIINMIFAFSWFAFIGLLGPVLLIVLVRPVWAYFK